MINATTHLKAILTIVTERGGGGERGDEELLHGVGVGGGEQVGGQDRARDGAGAGHHHLGVIVVCGCGIYWVCCRLPCFTIHPSIPLFKPTLHPPPPGSWR